ncbi:MAG: hypothetical protein EHM12_09100 [Dehalococcoidia bacterium]|nr:MAG: hypothetical protein EHM12_09100 [Dehalococcoidia bacterium]
MSRKADVIALLDDCIAKHNDIKRRYNDALKNKSLDLRIPVKNLMENLRSALDYIAHDIYDSICKPDRAAKRLPDPRTIYFPYSQQPADFVSSIGSSLPNLSILSPNVYSIVESIQPFKSGNSWLYDLCKILNENKHDRLVPQERKETGTYTVKRQQGSVSIARGPGISVTSMPGAVTIMGVPADFRGDHIATHPAGNLKHEIITWVAFIFEGTAINILGLLDKSVPGIKAFSVSLYRIL